MAIHQRKIISHHVHEEVDKNFQIGLAADPAVHGKDYEMRHALEILEEARRPVELTESRQGKLAQLSSSLKIIRPQLVSLDEHQRNLVKAGQLVASAIDLHALYRAVEQACPMVLPCTKCALLMVDPLDDERLVSETLNRTLPIAPEISVVGHCAATKETLNMAVADMSTWPTCDGREDDGLNPNQFHQSFSRDPTKSVVCVPILSGDNVVWGVLYAENEAKKQHFKRSGPRKSSFGPTQGTKKGIDNRARAPPYSQENEDAMVVLSRYIASSLTHIMNGDVQSAFAKHAARFRDMRKKHKVLKKFEQAVQRRRQKKFNDMRDTLASREKEIADMKADVQRMQAGFVEMQNGLAMAKASEEKALAESVAMSNKNKMLEAELKATHAGKEKALGQVALLSRRNTELTSRLKVKTKADTDKLEQLEARLEHYNLLLKTAEHDAKHEKAERIIKTLMLQGEATAFRGWYNGVQLQIHQKQQSKRIMARALNHVMAYNFDKFVKIWTDGKVAKAQKKKALAYFKNRELVLAMNMWRGYVARRTFIRNFINKLCKQYALKEIAKGFNSWKSYYVWSMLDDERKLAAEAMAKLKQRSQFCQLL